MTSLPYLVVFFVFVFSGFLENKLSKRQDLWGVRIFVIVTAIIFIGLRGHILTDFVNYYKFYEKLGFDTVFDQGVYSPGFVLFSYICKSLYLNYFAWIFLNSLIHVAILSFLFKKYLNNVSLGLAFYLAYRGVIIEFNLLQNALSLLLFFLSISSLSERRFGRYAFYNVGGAFFHISSILFLPLYWVLHLKCSRIFSVWLVVIANLFFWGGSDLIIVLIRVAIEQASNPLLAQYLYFFVDPSNYGLSVGYLERTLLIFIFIYYRSWIMSNIPNGAIFFNLALFYYCSFIMLAPIDVLVDRVTLLFILSYWVILPGLLVKSHKYRTILVFLFVTLGAVKLLLSVQDSVSRYENLLLGIGSYEDKKSEVLRFNKEKQ